MATKKTTYYYYVLVFTDAGPVYVTSVDNASHVAYWDKDKDPKALPKYYADDLAFGLGCNFIYAVVVTSKYELSQPYNYKDFECRLAPKSES